MIKTNGKEFKRFYNDDAIWPETIWHDDEELLVNGTYVGDLEYALIPDDAEVRITGGGIFGLPNDKEMSFEGYFRSWKKRQNIRTVVVECDVAKLEEVKAAIKAAGGKVL